MSAVTGALAALAFLAICVAVGATLRRLRLRRPTSLAENAARIAPNQPHHRRQDESAEAYAQRPRVDPADKACTAAVPFAGRGQALRVGICPECRGKLTTRMGDALTMSILTCVECGGRFANPDPDPGEE